MLPIYPHMHERTNMHVHSKDCRTAAVTLLVLCTLCNLSLVSSALPLLPSLRACLRRGWRGTRHEATAQFRCDHRWMGLSIAQTTPPLARTLRWCCNATRGVCLHGPPIRSPSQFGQQGLRVQLDSILLKLLSLCCHCPHTRVTCLQGLSAEP